MADRKCLGYTQGQRCTKKKWTNEQQLRKAIVQAWVEIDQDKALCQRLMASLPLRLQAVIKKNGRQIQKEDY